MREISAKLLSVPGKRRVVSERNCGEIAIFGDFSLRFRYLRERALLSVERKPLRSPPLKGARFSAQRPPPSAWRGLNKRPTLINNVETLSQVSYIVNQGLMNIGRSVLRIARVRKYSGLGG